VLYGWFHRRTLQVAHDKHKLEGAIHHREKLVAEAKDAWKRRQESAKDTTGNFSLYTGNFSLNAFGSYQRPRRPTVRPRKVDLKVGEEFITSFHPLLYY